MKFYDYINNTLKAYGCRKAFGVPGSLVMPIWNNLKDMELILCSHEQEASYAATGYSKASGELVAVVTTGSPGVTNCTSGIASANMDSVPMLYISGRTPARLKGYGVLQEESNINRAFNSVELLTPLTKDRMEINDISKAAQMFLEGCKKAISCRAGCVHVSISLDIQSLDLPSSEIIFDLGKDDIIPDFPDITKPLIILGWGSWQAGIVTQIYELAEEIGAPVLVTSKAYCCIWGEHPYYLGKLGYGYNPILENFLHEYSPEQVLVFGSSMGRKNISESCLHILQYAETYLYSIECEDVTSRFSKGHWIQVDNMTLMVNFWLRNMRPPNPNSRFSCNLKSVRQLQRMFFYEKIDSNDLMAQTVFELNNLCDDTCVVTADAGNHLLNTAVLYEPNRLGGMFIDAGIRAMGSSLCSSVGMALALKDKYFINVTGDGCMLMNGNVMYLAKRLNLPILFLVINNSSLGRVRVGQMEQKSFIASDLGNIDFMLYGKAFGMETYKATSIEEFRNAMTKILAEKKTAILEMCTDKDEIPLSLKEDQ
jgi:acetolactate synthase-1/2/3 large subunit